MAVADLAATGRKDGSLESVGGMIMIMAASDPAIEPLWEGPVSLGAPWNSEECQCFYDMLGYGACWRFIQDMRKAIWSGGSHGISCILDFANFTSTAGQVLVIDAIFQAAMLALIIVKDCPFQSDLMKECLSAWRFASIGFARFKHVPFSRPGRLELCNSWLNEKLIRFDGQIRAPNGEIIFTLHNLEFERVSSTDKSDI